MTPKYHKRSWSAMVGGLVAAAGATALLVRDAWTTGFTVDHALMPVMVGVTILAGHLLWQALASGRAVAAFGMLLVALFGSSLTVYETMGRRAQVRDASVAEVAAVEAKRTHLQGMLSEAEQILSGHRETMAKECRSGNGTRCKGQTYTVSTWEAAVAGYEAKLARLPPPRPVDAKAERIAAIAAAAGVTGVDVRKIVALVEPFAFPLFLELGSIVLFSFGLGRGSPNAPAPLPAPSVVTNDDDPVRSKSKEEALADLKMLLRVGQTVPSQDWLADRWKVSKGTVSKWASDWEADDQIPARQRDGKVKFLVAA